MSKLSFDYTSNQYILSSNLLQFNLHKQYKYYTLWLAKVGLKKLLIKGVSKMNMNDYFYKIFPVHLSYLIRIEPFTKEHIFVGDVRWQSFEQDIKNIPTENRPEFLLMLFMIIMTDQAVYTYEQNLYPLWHKLTGFPNFGTWGFGLYNENPFWILAKADTDSDLCSHTLSLIPEFASFLIKKTKEYFNDIFGDKIDISQYFTAILNDNAYKTTSTKPESEVLRCSKTISAFKQHFEKELKNNNLI